MTYTITPAPHLFVVVAWPLLVGIAKGIRRLILKGGGGLSWVPPSPSGAGNQMYYVH